MEKLMNVKEAAELLNVSEMTIRRWTNSGTLNCYRIGGKRERRFRVQDLQGYLDSLPSRTTKPVAMVRLGEDNTFVPDGTHLTHLAMNCTDALDVGSAYLLEGLANKEFVVMVTSKANRDQFINSLVLRGVDVEAVSSQGQLHISHGLDTPPDMIDFISQLATKFTGRFRLFGDMTWAQERKWKLGNIRQLEEMSNNFQGTSGALLLCQYPLNSFSAEELMMVVENHKYTLYKGVLQESPYFTIN